MLLMYMLGVQERKMCVFIMGKEKQRANCVIFSMDWQGLKCRCFSVFRVLSSLMASADSRGQTSHLHNSFHFRAPDKCLQNSSPLCEIGIFLQLSRRVPIRRIKPEEQYFFFFFLRRGRRREAQKKDGGGEDHFGCLKASSLSKCCTFFVSFSSTVAGVKLHTIESNRRFLFFFFPV